MKKENKLIIAGIIGAGIALVGYNFYQSYKGKSTDKVGGTEEKPSSDTESTKTSEEAPIPSDDPVLGLYKEQIQEIDTLRAEWSSVNPSSDVDYASIYKRNNLKGELDEKRNELLDTLKPIGFTLGIKDGEHYIIKIQEGA